MKNTYNNNIINNNDYSEWQIWLVPGSILSFSIHRGRNFREEDFQSMDIPLYIEFCHKAITISNRCGLIGLLFYPFLIIAMLVLVFASQQQQLQQEQQQNDSTWESKVWKAGIVGLTSLVLSLAYCYFLPGVKLMYAVLDHQMKNLIEAYKVPFLKSSNIELQFDMNPQSIYTFGLLSFPTIILRRHHHH